MSDVTVLILTPLSIEYKAVSRHLTDRESLVRDGATYEIGRFKGLHHTYKVVLREPGMKNTDMALATERAIQHFDPQIAILCGIAGGIKDVQKGDVAIARSAFNYDAGKEAENGFLPRPAEYHFSEDLLAYAQLVQRNDHWKKRCADGAPNAQVHIASVAAGDKVVAAVENATYERITQFLSHCKFLEMEAAGFGLAIQRYRNIHALVVRGISDMCKGKAESDEDVVDWQGVAAERAAGVVFGLLSLVEDLNFTQLKNMEIKDIVKETYALLFPAALKEIGKDFADAINGDIRTLWTKVKPLFIKEVEKLAKDPENIDRQGTVRMALADALEESAVLKGELERLLERVKEATSLGEGITVTNSEQTIIGSTINVGGNFHQGNQTNFTHHGNGDNVGGDKIIYK